LERRAAAVKEAAFSMMSFSAAISAKASSSPSLTWKKRPFPSVAVRSR
jgi:hypothetical protein